MTSSLNKAGFSFPIAVLFALSAFSCPGDLNISTLSQVLRCGMSESETLQKLKAHHISELHPKRHPRLGNTVGVRGDDNVWLNFDNDKLTSVAVVVGFGLMGARESPRYHLCSSLITVGLTLEAPPQFEGATVFVDGNPVGSIGKWLFLEVQLPVGSHEIKVEKSGVVTSVERVTYTADDDGNPRLRLKPPL